MQKFNISQADKLILEDLTSQKIYLRNSFEHNQKEIQGLLTQGITNAQVYLERNFLGQKLAMLDENQLFTSVCQLGQLLGMTSNPRRMECYDISHISGKFVYGSMVVFVDGRPISKFYRLFKCPERNDDFANHKEVMRRRLQRGIDYNNSLDTDKILDKAWQLPDLIIVDGGKGQLMADYEVLLDFGLENKVMMVSIAKREEEIFVVDNTCGFAQVKVFDSNTHNIGKEGGLLLEGQPKFLCQRIRDEAHRFAIKNNRNARLKTITKSQLDDIAGIGDKTKIKLLTQFGSLENLVHNIYDNSELVIESVGQKTFDKLKAKFC